MTIAKVYNRNIMKVSFIRRSGVLLGIGLLSFMFAAFALQPVAVSAQAAASQQACEALPDAEWRDGECITSGTDLNGIITVFVNIFSVIVAIVAVIMIIWGGFKYITSGGDSGNITTAKNTIIYAIIGLVIVALAQVLVQFVLSTVIVD